MCKQYNFCQILLLAMKDMNIAKLTSQDSPLFMAIIQDLFPGTEAPAMDYGKVTIDFIHLKIIHNNLISRIEILQ